MAHPTLHAGTSRMGLAGDLAKLVLQAAFILLPPLLAWELVDENRTNTLFLDDWVYVPLYEKAKLGQLTMHDLFGGYLEHRPAIIRIINISLTLLSSGDVSRQCVAGFIAVVLTWINCGWLLRRALGGWKVMWFPWGVMGWVLFSPVHWQGFLWPSCMLVNLPLLFLTTGLLVLGSTRLNVWIRLVGCAFCAWLATYSYAPGLILWLLLPMAVIGGYGIEDVRLRSRWLVGWFALMGIVVFCYFHGLKNEVEPAFAYGQGNEDTATHSIASLFETPGRGLRFAWTLLGANFARGILGPRGDLAVWMGAVLFVIFLGVCLSWLRKWRQIPLRREALPFLLIAAFAVAVAFMVAAGRAWASKDVGGALNNRYASYASALTAGLLGVFVVLFRNRGAHSEPNEPITVPMVRLDSWIARMKLPFAGALCALLAANWFYGAEMMRVWHYARLRGAVDVHFTPLLGQQQDRGRPAVHLELAEPRAATLNRLRFLDRPQAQTLDLTQFQIKGKLNESLGRLVGTDRKPDRIEVSGYAMLTMQRPPDAVLLTVRSVDSTERKIVDVSMPDPLPAFFLWDTLKDNQFIFDNSRPLRCGQWTAVARRDRLPQGKIRLEAWALNFEKFTVIEIGGGVSLDN